MNNVEETNLPGYLVKRGKARDLYDLGDELLMVATDRISAFDVVLDDPIPDKGRVLTGLSAFWFQLTKAKFPNHFITSDLSCFPKELWQHQSVLRDRSMLVKKGVAIPVECVVRGYLYGSAWKEYQKKQTVSGILLPPGLKESEELPAPLFTPTTKATAGHDEGRGVRDHKGQTW